jgi:hypothetical protein
MDELSRELELFEVIAASDARNNARTFLEVCAEDPPSEEAEELWEAIRRYVFPLLADEHDRLAVEYLRLRGEA